MQSREIISFKQWYLKNQIWWRYSDLEPTCTNCNKTAKLNEETSEETYDLTMNAAKTVQCCREPEDICFRRKVKHYGLVIRILYITSYFYTHSTKKRTCFNEVLTLHRKMNPWSSSWRDIKHLTRLRLKDWEFLKDFYKISKIS